MKRFSSALTLALVFAVPQVFAWSNHSFATYRALEQMPELANAAPVTVEPLEAFLKAEEKTVEALLASQEAWAAANLEKFPARPAALAFVANADRPDDARRLAFLMALRVAPNSKFALFIQPDPQLQSIAGTRITYSAVNTLPEPQNSGYKFIGLKPGDQIAPLAVVASASDEPDYGLDINLWDDSPSDWGKVYGFGPLPFGNPALNYSTQAPFHMGFYHEDRILYAAAPFIQRTFPLLRSYQYGSLAALAFRTGHAYWGWRFAGLSLHYLQDLTQPYHASLAPGNSTLQLLGANVLAMVGMSGKKDDMVVLLSNRHLAVEKYQKELLQNAANNKQDTAIEKALRNADKDNSYPDWSDRYVRDVVSAQSAAYAPRLAQTLVATVPELFVSDPSFDFGVKEAGISMVNELAKRDAAGRARLDSAVAELLGNFGAHSRNAVRSILKASNQQ
ncbi:MAG: hypothetical protein Q8R67_10415 [Rhodoferax sp.]|nr:hypothetical protein [Rhodoferax sp.]MDP3652083.1 hypothetical protein [Rhodoferax sp.]